MSPTCQTARIGCIGSAWCDYCGRPLIRRDARERLVALIRQLRGTA